MLTCMQTYIHEKHALAPFVLELFIGLDRLGVEVHKPSIVIVPVVSGSFAFTHGLQQQPNKVN